MYRNWGSGKLKPRNTDIETNERQAKKWQGLSTCAQVFAAPYVVVVVVVVVFGGVGGGYILEDHSTF